jgi:hypothetical protein
MLRDKTWNEMRSEGNEFLDGWGEPLCLYTSPRGVDTLMDGENPCVYIQVQEAWTCLFGEGPMRRTIEGGSEWEPIKIILERDEDSNKTNTASNTRLRLTT